jgi:4-methyl-5(b-hydroxyethyl)-thiazole monophosphate biosynthesis
MSKKILTVFAEGFEEIEAVTAVDLLKRGGIVVETTGIKGIDISGAHGISIIADHSFDEISDEYDGIIIPGGMPGSTNIAACKSVLSLIKKMYDEGKLICAICAAPAIVLNKTGILSGKKATCYPGFEKEFDEDVQFTEERVVVDDNVITSRGAGTAADFSHAIIKYLVDEETADKVLDATLYK